MNFTKLTLNLCSVGLAAVLFAGAAHAEAVRGPFATFPGSWSGGGAISMASGAVERLRCKADYTLDDGGATLAQTLDCTSDSYTFQLKDQVQATGSDIAGHWLEVTRHAEGTVVGQVSGGRIEGTVTGPGLHRHLLAASACQPTAGSDQGAGGRHRANLGRAHPRPLTRSDAALERGLSSLMAFDRKCLAIKSGAPHNGSAKALARTRSTGGAQAYWLGAVSRADRGPRRREMF